MKECDWNKIKECLVVLHEELEPDNLVSRLYQVGILTDDDQERITCERTRLDKVKKLLQIIRTKQLPKEDVYSVFLNELRATQAYLADSLKPPGKARRASPVVSEAAKGRNIDTLQDLDVEEFCQFLEPILKKNNVTDPDKVIQAFRDEKITGRVFLNTSETNLKEICPLLKFGDRKNIMLEREEFIKQSQSYRDDQSNEDKGGLQQREYARKFGTSPGFTEKYKKGNVLKNLQTSFGQLTDTLHLCIPLCGEIDDESAHETIGWETIKFLAACMNDRTNGTIHFGVYDGTDGTHEHGEVAGLTGVEQGDCEGTISSWIEKCFPQEKHTTAKSCISPPVYVDVISSTECSGFVLEIDIEPKAGFVQDDVYFVLDQYIEKGKKETRKQYFRFKNGIPEKQDLEGTVRLTKSSASLTKQRMEAEKVLATKREANESLLRQLQEFFCDGDVKMGDVYPILVINAMDKDVSLEDLHSKFAFLAEIDWICIFDFDPLGCNTGMYNYLENKQDKEFKVKLTDDFDQRGNKHPQRHLSVDKLHEEMNSSNLIPWIFCNGYAIMDKSEFGLMEWKKQRSEGFKEAVRYFSYEIPKDRAKIVYLLLSKDYSVMLEAAEEICLKFQNQWMVIAETDSVAAQWQEQMICRSVVEKMSLERHFITGYKWEDISTCMKAITGESYDVNSGECSLITHLGPSIQLPKNHQNKLCDLDILSSTECGMIDTLGEDDKTKLATEHETKFYQGYPPSWVNFYHGVHVLKRKNHGDLLKNVDMVLNGDVPDNTCIGRVTIYHQPGSGGTTTAKQVLWDLKEKFRCCMLKSYSKESHDQIVELWKYGENVKKARPILVMLDNLEEEKLQSLTEALHVEANKHIQGGCRVMCVLLLCQRQSSLPPERERIKFVLKQELHPEEKTWFRSKYNNLAESFKKQKGPDPRHLLSLNIMKENFNERYIENTVAEILRDITISEEKILIKNVSLLNAYDQQFRGVPVASFNSMMAKRARISGKSWELGLSSSANMLLMRTKSQVTCLRVINPLLCKWVLSNLTKAARQTLGDAVLQFLSSDPCRDRHQDMASNNLFIILKDMMKNRELTASGRTARFSRLIQELYDSQNVDTAADILEDMFWKTEDPYIAQQLARLYIHCENWRKASQFANEATNLLPNSSYLWDTHGQVYKVRLAKLFETGFTADKEANKKTIQEAVECGYEGTGIFLKVQELSCSEQSLDPNAAGYFGEIETCISLLDALSLCPGFKKKSDLQMFLNGKSKAPEEFMFLTEKQIEWLGGLQGRVFTTLRKIEDEALRDNPVQASLQSSRSRLTSKGSLDRLRRTLGSYFGDDELPSLEEAKMSTSDKRRRQVRKLGVTSLQSILGMVKDDSMKEKIGTIYQLMKHNTGDPQCLPYDCRIALGSALALQIIQSPPELPNFEGLLQMSTQLYNMKYDGNYIDLEPYFYFLLLHWPTQKRKQLESLTSPDILLDALKKWNNAYMKKYPEDKRRTIPGKPFFFLTSKAGVESVVHIDQLKENRGGYQPFMHHQLGKVLGMDVNRQILERFSGMLSNRGWEVSVQLETPRGNKLPPFQIPLYTRDTRQSLLNKKVYFVLGFCWSGPMACDIQTEGIMPLEVLSESTMPQHVHTFEMKRHEEPRQQMMMTPILYPSFLDQIWSIQQDMFLINQLKGRPKNQLTPEQKNLVQQESSMIARIQRLLQKRHFMFLEFV